MRPPAFESENHTHGAKKIGPSQHSDFFNRIGQERTRRLKFVMPSSRATSSTARLREAGNRSA